MLPAQLCFRSFVKYKLLPRISHNRMLLSLNKEFNIFYTEDYKEFSGSLIAMQLLLLKRMVIN